MTVTKCVLSGYLYTVSQKRPCNSCIVSLGICQWKNFENRSTLAEVTIKSQAYCVWDTVYNNTTAVITIKNLPEIKQLKNRSCLPADIIHKLTRGTWLQAQKMSSGTRGVIYRYVYLQIPAKIQLSIAQCILPPTTFDLSKI